MLGLYIYLFQFVILFSSLKGSSAVESDEFEVDVRLLTQGRRLEDIFDIIPDPNAQEDKCFEDINEGGGCKASLLRYFYNETSNKCESFRYTGCDGSDNRFFSLRKCKSACVRKDIKPMTKQFCRMQVLMLDQCRVTNSLQDMTLCGDVSLTTNQSNCLANNCCWHPDFKLCYASAVRTLSSNRCRMLYQDRKSFIGLATFQSNGFYKHGWVGYLKFTNAVSGNFCILSNTVWRNDDVTGKKLGNGEEFVLKGGSQIYGGQIVHVLFAATYNVTSNILDKSCLLKIL